MSILFANIWSSTGTVPDREISEMKARLFLNLGLVCDHLGEPKRCSEFIRRSVFIAEYEHPKLLLQLSGIFIFGAVIYICKSLTAAYY